MANRIEKRGEWSTDTSKFVYVEIPAKDMYDHPYPTFRLNAENYVSGKKHFVPPEVGAELVERMKVFEQGLKRLMLPTPDRNAQRIADGQGNG